MNARREPPPNDEDVLVFAGSGSVRLTDAICTELGVARGRGETIRFSEGTLFVRVLENVRGRAVSLGRQRHVDSLVLLTRSALRGEMTGTARSSR